MSPQARDGILPTFLTGLHPRYRTPHVALLFSSAVGLVILIPAYYISSSQSGLVLIHMSLVGALTSYALQLIAFLVPPPFEREPSAGTVRFRSPVGRLGAYLGLLLVLGMGGCLVFLAIGDRIHTIALSLACGVLLLASVVYVLQRRPSPSGVPLLVDPLADASGGGGPGVLIASGRGTRAPHTSKTVGTDYVRLSE